jgi:excisionase family DNA binding protein
MPHDTQPHNRTNGLPCWQWLTVGEVARSIGLTEERVRQLIRARKIKATKIGGWLVQPEDLSAFIQSRTNIRAD